MRKGPTIKTFPKILAASQGAYFIITGLWPILSPASFEAITQTHAPAWMFRSIGILMATIGYILIESSVRSKTDFGSRRLGQLTALAIAWIDFNLIRQGVIGSLNYADIVLQILFAVSWSVTKI